MWLMDEFPLLVIAVGKLAGEGDGNYIYNIF